MSLLGEWLVKRAQNPDIERRHLNKILQEIRDSIDEIHATEARIAQMLGAAFAIAGTGGGDDSGGGSPGAPGATGPAGAAGSTGSQGPTGLPIFLVAENGLDGEPGPPGRAGTTGSTGAQGPTGLPIFLVAETLDGEQGIPGVKGATGATGAQGPVGPPIFLVAEALDGEQGIQGPQGLTGLQGPQGPQAFFTSDTYNEQDMWPQPMNQAPSVYDLTFAISDETTAITTGAAKLTWTVRRAMTVTGIVADLTTVSSSGTPTFDVNKNGSSMFSTVITVDVSEVSSTTAAVPAVLTTFSLVAGDVLTFDIDVAGTGTKGVKITILGYAT